MPQPRANEVAADLIEHMRQHRQFARPWQRPPGDHPQLREALGPENGNALLYINPDKKLLLLLEHRPANRHRSEAGDRPKHYAVDGIRALLSHFTEAGLKGKPAAAACFRHWHIGGIALSGPAGAAHETRISTFIVSGNTVREAEVDRLLDEDDYIAYFENLNLEAIAQRIARSSGDINRMLRALDSQKRPVLLSALMICLYEKDAPNEFKKSYAGWDPRTLTANIPPTVEHILTQARIDADNIKVLLNELAFIATDPDLSRTHLLRDILKELEYNVLPLFGRRTDYDIIGKFYEEFLRYAGITNVKKGIVLTPNHVAALFTELVGLRRNDVVIDICCGTGTFLISAMNRLGHRDEAAGHDRLIGFEKNATLYTLAVSNMLFRGEARARIFNVDAFSAGAEALLDGLKKEGIRPTVGFINPPYGGKDNATNPTKKEVQFLERMLDIVSGHGVIIAPLSTYFNDEAIRNRILERHTLKYVINMPLELFKPSAVTNTAIAVFETQQPHNGQEVVFYQLTDDGLVLSKNRGRTDVLNKWTPIRRDLLQKLRHPDRHEDGIRLVKTVVGPNDEWIIQAHARVDYAQLDEQPFIRTIKDHILFTTKRELGILEQEPDAITLLELLSGRFSPEPDREGPLALFGKRRWADFSVGDLFHIRKGERLVEIDRVNGSTPLVTASAYNNGISAFIEEEAYAGVKRLSRNRITVDMFCNVFYHDYPYFSDDNIHTLTFRDKAFEKYYNNLYINIFLVSILRQLAGRYGFGRQVRLKRLEHEIIRLPVKNKKPDWAFMEDYIRSLPYSSSIPTR